MTKWVMTVLVGAMACSSREGDHEGKPMAYWVAEMTSPDSARRHRAVEAFAHDASRSPDAARALMAVLASELEADVHSTVAEALGTLGPNALEAVPALVRLLKDEHVIVRERAASALGGVCARSPLVLPALVHSLSDSHYNVRAAAAEALGRIGPDAASASAPLARLVTTDRIGWVRRQSAKALGLIAESPDVAVPALTKATVADWSEMRVVALDALAQFGSRAASALPAIRAAARDTEPETRAAALRATAAISKGVP
jgi:HEAT repeat protein